MRLTMIRVHPMKTARGVELDRAAVLPWGLAGDRRWAAVAAGGAPIGVADYRRLLGIQPTGLPDGGLVLTAPGHPRLSVAPPDPATAAPLRAGRLGTVLAAGPPGDGWISTVLGRPAHLVWQPDPTDRPVPDAHGVRAGGVTSLADEPLLLTSQSSLDQLNDWVAAGAVERGEEPPDRLAMSRFRPNVVIDGGPPFVEDDWKRLRIGPVDFHVAELCDRCAMTTYDPETLVNGDEPIRTLSRYRRWEGRTWFGVRLVPDTTGTIAVGDEVTIVA